MTRKLRRENQKEKKTHQTHKEVGHKREEVMQDVYGTEESAFGFDKRIFIAPNSLVESSEMSFPFLYNLEAHMGKKKVQRKKSTRSRAKIVKWWV